MAASITQPARRLARWLFDRLDGHGVGRHRWPFRLLSRIWRSARALHHRWLKPRPRVMIVLDAPARLEGFSSLSGWVVGKMAPIVKLEAWFEQRLLEEIIPDEPRPDVSERFPHWVPHGCHGFRITPAPGRVANGCYPLTLKAIDALGNQGILKTVLEVHEYRVQDRRDFPVHLRGSDREYQAWLQRPNVQGDNWHEADTSTTGPLISIIMPIYQPNLEHLRQAIASVRQQSYSAWELCLCDDGSEEADLNRWLAELAKKDARIKVTQLPINQGIAHATQEAIQSSSGSYLAFMDQDDQLHPRALAEVAKVVREQLPDLIYTDEDRIDDRGCRVQPFFKPDFSLELLRSFMYLAHLCVYQRTFLRRIGGLRSDFDGCQDWELALRAVGRTSRIVHIPQVLYHWRMGGHSAQSTFNRICHERARRALIESMHRLQEWGSPIDGPIGCSFHRRYHLPPPRPLVSILIPTCQRTDLLRRCLRTLRSRTNYHPIEVLVLDNHPCKPLSNRLAARWGADRVLHFPIPFNHSLLNNLGAQEAKGSLLLLLNDDTELTDSHWLTFLVEQACRPGIGAVGARLLYPDGRTQHAGVVTHPQIIARNLNSSLLGDGIDRGMVRLQRNVSAVTGACLLTPKDLFLTLGGLDELHLPTSFNDVDYCLKLRHAGYQIMYQPLARLIHHETASRTLDEVKDREARTWMLRKWGIAGLTDPYWNPNLTHGEPPGFAFHWPEFAEPDQAMDAPIPLHRPIPARDEAAA